MLHPITKWVIKNIDTLPNESKYRACNAIRALNWASVIYRNSIKTPVDLKIDIPATYCALHATEEAVAAFICCAQKCGYGADANINIKRHHHKSTISLLAQKLQNFFTDFHPAIAYDEAAQKISLRLTINNDYYYEYLSLKSFTFDHKNNDLGSTDFYQMLLKAFTDEDGLVAEIKRSEQARITTFYATETGYPTGFDEPEEALVRECQLTLGLIWAAIDMNKNDEKINLIQTFLKTAKMAIKTFEKR